MPRLAVFTAHSGKAVELEVGHHARVEAVQQMLADLTGIPQADQILMCEGARLDGAKPLASYGLPGEEQGKVHDVFLYSRAHLRPDAPPPPLEALPDCPLDLSGLEAIQQQRHRLDSEGSPLLRLLPDYQRQFQQHLLQANAQHGASQQRMATCAQLVSEQEVQALSIDAATANVELHYAYICDAFSTFTHRFRQQHAVHAEVLARFEADLQYLAATELHPALRGSDAAHGGAPPTLAHLVSAEQLREAAAACARGHQHFGAKVAELDALFGMLKADVEALFMQAPSVDLEALTRQLEEMHHQVDEQASIAAALSSDLNKVQQLVEQASEQLAADPAASVQVSDTVHMLETMRETHVGHLVPRVEACHAAVEGFAAQCLDCKNALTRDVFTQLRTISSQQSKIREMKNKLALEALARQDGAVQELLVVRRVPAAYKQCLAECVRREAFMEKYAHSAGQLAERMGTFREKELAMRDAFRKHVERLIPAQLLERMGLLEQPPHCQVSVSAAEGERLLGVTVDDVRRIQLPWASSSSLMAALPSPSTAAATAGGSGSRDGSVQATAEQQQQQQEEAAAAAEVDVTATLQLENARLRSELAAQIALDCIRSAQLAGMGGAAGGAARAGSGHASPYVSTASSPRTGPASMVASGTAAAPAIAPEAAQRFERALAAKDSLAVELAAQLAAARQQVAAYELRIRQLEAQQLSVAAAPYGHPAGSEAVPLLAGSGIQAAPSATAASSAASSPARSADVPAAATASSGLASSGMAARAPAVLPATPGAQQAAVAAAGLSSSTDAAAGSSLAGSVHAPDTSRSLGASTSLSASQPQQHTPSATGGWQPASITGAVGIEVQPVGSGPLASRPLAVSASGSIGAASVPDPAPAASLHAPYTVLPPVEAAGEAPVLSASVEQPADQEPAPLGGSTAGAAEAQAGAVPHSAEAETETAASPPSPAKLLASLVADEGSDVEGIEPLEDSSDEEQQQRQQQGEAVADSSHDAGDASAGEPPAADSHDAGSASAGEALVADQHPAN